MGIRFKVNEHFFDRWNPTMAYVLGYWYADGSLEDATYLRGKYIRVTSVDKQTIVKIRRWLGSQHTIVPLKSYWPHGKMRYLLRIGNHRLFDALQDRGLYPNKSLTVQLPPLPKKYHHDFIRGYFDGDGCVHVEYSKGDPCSPKKLTIIFTSGSQIFLEQLCILLKEFLALKQDKVYKTHRAFQLRYSTADSIKVFKFLYRKVEGELYLKRKVKVFTNYFSLRPKRVDYRVQSIVALVNGPVVK